MASLASPLRGLLPAPSATPASDGGRRSDAHARHEHARLGETVALAEATNAVGRRTAFFRRALIVADVASAAFALALSVQILGDDRLKLATVAAFPLVVVISKLIGLYDRDELLLEKKTIDEAPALFQLATLFTLVAWIGERQLIVGHFGRDQVVGVWGCLFLSSVAGRGAARRIARHATPDERILVVGEPEACSRVDAKLNGNRRVAAQVVLELP